MPGSTPILGLPYPLPTDPISDGDDVIQDLAEAVEALITPGPFAAPIFEHGWANGPGTLVDPVGYRLYGDHVELKGLMQNPGSLSPGTNDVAFTLPPGFRPARSRIFITAGGAGIGTSWVNVGVYTSGAVSIQNIAGGAAAGMTVWLDGILCPLGA